MAHQLSANVVADAVNSLQHFSNDDQDALMDVIQDYFTSLVQDGDNLSSSEDSSDERGKKQNILQNKHNNTVHFIKKIFLLHLSL